MMRSEESSGSWVHVFTLRERVASAVAVLEEPHSVEYIARLADGTPEETEFVLDRLVEDGVVRSVEDEYAPDPTASMSQPEVLPSGVDPDELDADTLRQMESAVRTLRDADATAYAEMSDYAKGRLEGYTSVLRALSELLGETNEAGNERADRR